MVPTAYPFRAVKGNPGLFTGVFPFERSWTLPFIFLALILQNSGCFTKKFGLSFLGSHLVKFQTSVKVWKQPIFKVLEAFNFVTPGCNTIKTLLISLVPPEDFCLGNPGSSASCQNWQMQMAADCQLASPWFSPLHNLNFPGYCCFCNSLKPQKSPVSPAFLVVLTGSNIRLQTTPSYPEAEIPIFLFGNCRVLYDMGVSL